MDKKDKKIIAVIPARSGSKRIPDKNIINFRGKPLLAWTIEQAKKVKKIDRVIVSTNSELYGVTAGRYGAEVVFRPDEISKDDSLDLDCFQHLLAILDLQEEYYPDILVHLRPTYPTRNIKDIENALEIFLESNATSLRSITRSEKSVFKKYFVCKDGTIVPCIYSNVEYYNMPRQLLEPDYSHNGCIDIVLSKTVLQDSMSGDHIIPYYMNQSEINDIDTPGDVERISIEQEFGKYSTPRGKTFCFDIDGVICTVNENNAYDKALPIRSGINMINKLHETNHVILFTARGSLSGIDWIYKTKKQLENWKVNYDELRFNKPAADYYIDDKMINLAELKRKVLGYEDYE